MGNSKQKRHANPHPLHRRARIPAYQKLRFSSRYMIKPSLSHLRVFGCAAHVHIPVERRKKYGDGKVDYHSTRHYFVGYDTKAESIYSVWNPSDDSGSIVQYPASYVATFPEGCWGLRLDFVFNG